MFPRPVQQTKTIKISQGTAVSQKTQKTKQVYVPVGSAEYRHGVTSNQPTCLPCFLYPRTTLVSPPLILTGEVAVAFATRTTFTYDLGIVTTKLPRFHLTTLTLAAATFLSKKNPDTSSGGSCLIETFLFVSTLISLQITIFRLRVITVQPLAGCRRQRNT